MSFRGYTERAYWLRHNNAYDPINYMDWYGTRMANFDYADDGFGNMVVIPFPAYRFRCDRLMDEEH